MKKIKGPGDNISLKTRKNEEPIILEWINAQTNLMDSIRYLIEKEVADYGVRNLQSVVPMERKILSNMVPSSFYYQHYVQETAATKYEERIEELDRFDDEIDAEDIESWT